MIRLYILFVHTRGSVFSICRWETPLPDLPRISALSLFLIYSPAAQHCFLIPGPGMSNETISVSKYYSSFNGSFTRLVTLSSILFSKRSFCKILETHSSSENMLYCMCNHITYVFTQDLFIPTIHLPLDQILKHAGIRKSSLKAGVFKSDI